ncbi:MAG: asparagine synthase-related protein, partial [Gaiellaceae bacterium]
MAMATPPGMTTVEAAVAVPFDPARARVRARPAPPVPLEALERALLPALARPPCGVAFSGGRDSSALLAAAVRAARRAGLEEPVAVTLRFPGRARAEESRWQELVARAVGLERWEILEIGDELDFVGPLTTARVE